MISLAKRVWSTYRFTLATSGPVGALLPVNPTTRVMSGTSQSWMYQLRVSLDMCHRRSDPRSEEMKMAFPWADTDVSMGLALPCTRDSTSKACRAIASTSN